MSIKKYLEKLEDLSNKKILITGATSGIGLALVKHLLFKNAHIVFLARNKDKTEKIISQLKEIYPNSSMDYIAYDQAKEASILNAVKEIHDKHLDMYALVCNAGTLANKKDKDEKGRPLILSTNYLGLKYFLDNLLPTLSKQDKQYKVVIQGSFVAKHKLKKSIDINNDAYPFLKQYAISKTCVEILFSYLYKDYNQSHPNISFMCSEPGLTSTDIIRGFKKPIRVMGKVFLKLVSHKVEKASLTAYKCLESTTKNGDYYVPRGIFTLMGYPKKKKFS